MVLLPGGAFTMGDAKGAPDEKPHKVTVDAFDHRQVRSHAGAVPQARRLRLLPLEEPPRRPTEQVTWSAAAKYCNVRSRAEGLTPCYDTKTWKCDFTANGYRLPTEAEWEYAARAGNDHQLLLRRQRRRRCATSPGPRRTAAAARATWARSSPNPWGLYDMLRERGGVVQRLLRRRLLPEEPGEEPPRTGLREASASVRGGSWNSRAGDCRSAYRASENPAYSDVCIGYYDVYGFRCVRKP